MRGLKLLLLLSTVGIYALTVIAVLRHGINWPAVAIHDLMSLNWRSQFDFDFIVYLILFAVWIVWREGRTAKAYAFGVISIAMGGMFAFPYLIYAIVQAGGQPARLLLGVHAPPAQG